MPRPPRTPEETPQETFAASPVPAEAAAAPLPAAAPVGSARSVAPRQLWLALGLYLLSATTTFTGVAWLASRAELADREARIQELERVAEAAKRQRQNVETRLLRAIEDLDATAEHQRETIQRLGELHAQLRYELTLTGQELQAVAEERDAAQELAESLDSGVKDQELLHRKIATERGSLLAKLASLEAKLAAVEEEREAAKRTEGGLRRRLAAMEARLAEARSQEEDEAPVASRRTVTGAAAVVERALARAGVDIQSLLARVGEGAAGQGGPLEPARALDGVRLASAEPAPDLAATARRLQAVDRLIEVLPLAAPLGDYKLMSGFGVRQDPITRRRAVHAGLDFSAGADARIAVTGHGKVVSAGRDGSYGLAVVIDHGLGITTRYAHLKSIAVEAGQQVAPGRIVGIMGSTGRSTGRHLHYEVRIDGKAVDPLPFLEAGKQLHVRKG